MTNCHNRFLNFHKSWIKPCSETPEQLSYAKATDALVKSLRLIAEPLKIKRAKDLLSELHAKCEERHFKKKIDVYVKSLKNIIKSNMRKTEREKARTLLDRYKKASKEVFRCKYADRQEARTWRKERNRKMCTPSVHIETNNGNETFRDSNYEVIWANGQSPSSKEHRMTYGRTQGKNQIWLFVELLKKSSMKDHVLLRRNIFQSQETTVKNDRGYNLYKVAILCQGGMNKIASSRGNEFGTKSFGAHVYEGYIPALRD
ncbi:hypothetical protein RhiirA4_549050 [Rhizophagus irregularis]|uniref:Uncharacterized protein n=1 Tax=Rhizophagus irregularis TaxID=588596 RepID=A0A2I1HB00_9GLOM|nr:hypothetical protein RhiirA4_549050 [Rhizophagus irregularis]